MWCVGNHFPLMFSNGNLIGNCIFFCLFPFHISKHYCKFEIYFYGKYFLFAILFSPLLSKSAIHICFGYLCWVMLRIKWKLWKENPLVCAIRVVGRFFFPFQSKIEHIINHQKINKQIQQSTEIINVVRVSCPFHALTHNFVYSLSRIPFVNIA